MWHSMMMWQHTLSRLSWSSAWRASASWCAFVAFTVNSGTVLLSISARAHTHSKLFFLQSFYFLPRFHSVTVLLSISARALTHNTFFSHFQSFSIIFVRFNSGTLLLSISARVHPFYGRGAEDGVVWEEKKEKIKEKEKERNTSVAMGETRRMA